MDNETYQTIRAYCLHDLAEYVDPKRDYGAMQIMQKLHGDTGEMQWDFENAIRLFTSRALTPRQKAAAHLLAVVSNHRGQTWRRETPTPDGAEPQSALMPSEIAALAEQTEIAKQEYAKFFTETTTPSVLLPKSRLDKDRVHRVNKLENKSQPLAAEIKEAKKRAIDEHGATSVWAELIQMAEGKQGAMVGYSSDGIQYRGAQYQNSGEPDVFTLKNLRDRMWRAQSR